MSRHPAPPEPHLATDRAPIGPASFVRPRRCRGDSPSPSRPRPAPPPQSPPGCLSSCSPREPPPQPAAGRHSRLPGPSQGATAVSPAPAFACTGQSLDAWLAGRIWLTSLPSGLSRGSLAASGTCPHDLARAGCACKDSVVDVTRRRAAMAGDASDSQVTIKNIEKELICPACKELFTHPLILLCQHSVCHKCVKELLLSLDDSFNDVASDSSNQSSPRLRLTSPSMDKIDKINRPVFWQGMVAHTCSTSTWEEDL